MLNKSSRRLWFIVVVACSFVSATAIAAPYVLTDLGNLGGTSNYVFAINNFNEITGNSDGAVVASDQIDENNPPDSCSSSSGGITTRIFCTHAYFYKDGVMTDLGDLGISRSYGFAINDNSTVVGYGIEIVPDEDDDPANNSILERAIVSFDGGMIQALPYPTVVNLPELTLLKQRALDISNDRKIVGYTNVFLTNEAGDTTIRDRPFLYDYDTGLYTILPLFSDEILRSGVARAINGSGLVVGWAFSEEEASIAHAFVWDPTTPALSTDLGTLGGYRSFAFNINDNGIIVGQTETSKLLADNQFLAFIFDPSQETPMMAIPEFSDDESFKTSNAYGINNNNQVVGTAQISAGFTPNFTAFLYDYDSGTLINLNDMVDCSLGFELVLARDINDDGFIVGTGIVNGEIHSFLLTPTADTLPTNCTELRKQVEDDNKAELLENSGSFTPFSLIFMSCLIYFRRAKRKGQWLF